MTARAKTADVKTPASRARRKVAVAAPKSTPKKKTMAQVQQERDQLHAKLESSQARIAELEQLLEETINRIDWVIDSLQNSEAGKP